MIKNPTQLIAYKAAELEPRWTAFQAAKQKFFDLGHTDMPSKQ